MHRLVRRVFVGAWCSWQLAAPLAWAEDTKGAEPPPSPRAPSPAQLAEAQRAFARGRASLEGSDPASALEEFRRAAEIKNTPGLHFFMAICLEEMNRLREAAREYDEAEALSRELPAPDVDALLPEARERLTAATPRLTLEGLPPDSVVRVDEREVDASAPLLLDPGFHRLTVTSPAHRPFEATLDLVRGEQRRVRPRLVPLPAPQAPSPPSAPPTSPLDEGAPGETLHRVFFWSAVGVAVTGVGLGIVGSVTRAQADGDVSRHGAAVDEESGGSSSACSVERPPAACDSLSDALSLRGSASTWEWVGYTTGVVGAALATALHFAWPEAPGGGAAQPRLGLYFEGRAGGGGLGVHGTF